MLNYILRWYFSMKKRIKLFAIIQAILLMISYLTVSVYAGDGVTELPPIINNTAGENTFWHFDSSTGILEFVLFEEDKEGTIDINVINRWHDPQYDPGYDPRYAPWYNLRNQITRIEIDEGIVFIGNKSFYGCNKVTSLSLPESLREIGNEAFTGCKMKTLKLSDNITKIGYEAFMSCTALENIMLPKSLISIGDSKELSLRPFEYTEIGFDEFPFEYIVVVVLIPDFAVIGYRLGIICLVDEDA